MDELLQILFGDLTFAFVIGMILWSLIGFFISTYIEIKQRDVNGTKTPKKFKIMFWIKDNWKRVIATLLLIFIQIRFFEQINGVELTPYMALLVGMTSDFISGFSKRNIKQLQSDRVKLLNKYEPNEEI